MRPIETGPHIWTNKHTLNSRLEHNYVGYVQWDTNVIENFNRKPESKKKKNYVAYLKKNKIEILALKILAIKIENPMDECNNRLGTAKKRIS